MSDARTEARDAVLAHFAWVGGHADIWSVFADATAFERVVTALAEPFVGDGVTAVCGVESRGFLLGGAVARDLGVGFVALRKAGGLLPGPKHIHRGDPDYRGLAHTLRLQRDRLGPADRVLLVDDWAERGSQARSARALVDAAGAAWAGVTLVVDQLDDATRSRLGRVEAVVRAHELGPSG